MFIGSFALANNVFAAPMAGVTDRPFRMLCKKLGAGYAVSEMVTSRRDLWDTLKTSRRANHDGEPEPIAVQIAGTDAQMMADAAAYNIDRGAQIIDINMGCPAKKVCNKWAGSALMQDEALALSIVEAVVSACAPHGVPVTLKMRTGWSHDQKNAVVLARAAVAVGVAGLFMETHPDPLKAMSDGPNAVPLKHMKALLETLLELDRVTKKNGFIENNFGV